MDVLTPEQRERRIEHFRRMDEKNLLEKYRKAVKEKNHAKAHTLAWALVKFHGYDADHDFGLDYGGSNK